MNFYQKKALLLSLLIALLVTIWKKSEHENIKIKTQANWIHIKKDESGKLIKSSVSSIDTEEIKDSTRTPANEQKPKNTNEKIIFINLNNAKHKPELNELTFVNSYNPEWRELLGKELMLFQPESVEVYFKPLKSVVKILEDNKAMFLEEVSVTYKTNFGPRSFKALINSENGKVVESWGKTHYDNFAPRMPASEKGLTPNGSL